MSKIWVIPYMYLSPDVYIFINIYIYYSEIVYALFFIFLKENQGEP